MTVPEMAAVACASKRSTPGTPMNRKSRNAAAAKAPLIPTPFWKTGLHPCFSNTYEFDTTQYPVKAWRGFQKPYFDEQNHYAGHQEKIVDRIVDVRNYIGRRYIV